MLFVSTNSSAIKKYRLVNTSHWPAINTALSFDIERGPPRPTPYSNELHNELSSKYRKKLLKAHIKNAHKSLLRQDLEIYGPPFVKSRNLHVEPRYKWRQMKINVVPHSVAYLHCGRV